MTPAFNAVIYEALLKEEKDIQEFKRESDWWIAAYKLAIRGAGDIPIEIEINCLTIKSPKFILLFFITKYIASIKALPGYL